MELPLLVPIMHLCKLHFAATDDVPPVLQQVKSSQVVVSPEHDVELPLLDPLVHVYESHFAATDDVPPVLAVTVQH